MLLHSFFFFLFCFFFFFSVHYCIVSRLLEDFSWHKRCKGLGNLNSGWTLHLFLNYEGISSSWSSGGAKSKNWDIQYFLKKKSKGQLQCNIFLNYCISCIKINSALLCGCILFIYLFFITPATLLHRSVMPKELQQFDALQYCICVYFPANIAAISKGRRKYK